MIPEIIMIMVIIIGMIFITAGLCYSRSSNHNKGDFEMVLGVIIILMSVIVVGLGLI